MTLELKCKFQLIAETCWFSNRFFKKLLLGLLFCVCLFITVVQITVVRHQHLNCSRIASVLAVSADF